MNSRIHRLACSHVHQSVKIADFFMQTFDACFIDEFVNVLRKGIIQLVQIICESDDRFMELVDVKDVDFGIEFIFL